MLNIAFAQMNSTVGDLDGNINKMLNFAREAKEKHQADLIVFPELVISGYSPEDFLFRNDFLEACYNHLLDYANKTSEISSIVGIPFIEDGLLKNAAVFIKNGKIDTISFKQELPNYGVFDEKRYFFPGNSSCLVEINHCKIGIAICEDLWSPKVAAQLKKSGAQMIISLNASPFEIDKSSRRLEMLNARIQELALPILYVNCIGGQDELIFDGGSMLLDAQGNLMIQLPCFEEKCGVFQISNDGKFCNVAAALLCPPGPENGRPQGDRPYESTANVYNALKLGIQDYVRKNGFKKVIVGSSGGIDSAVTLAIAVDALGAENVRSVMMPSKYTAQMSLDDAKSLAENLKINHDVITISNCFDAFESTLKPQFKNLPSDKTEENLQARIRGTLLMALSNKTGALVLITGNRSEMAVGYATLYGDMAGGFAVLKDVYKTQVYQLAEYINQDKIIIPDNIITRPPSAELAEGQKDEDSLPPYSILDEILALYLDEELSIEEIAQKGFDKTLIKEIVRMIYLNEYKRQQSPPGIRIHHKAFGRDRRYPITNIQLP